MQGAGVLLKSEICGDGFQHQLQIKTQFCCNPRQTDFSIGRSDLILVQVFER